MAQKPRGDAPTRTNRFRMIVIDSDLSDGAIANLTHAITNALRPAPLPAIPQPRTALLAIPGGTGNGDISSASDIDTSEPETELMADDAEEPGPPPSVAGPKVPRKLPLPTYLHDLDLKGDTLTFKEYAKQQDPKKHAKRYLVASCWVKEHGKQETINADKVYTCYKTAGWPVGINDWDVNFRNHVKANRMRRVNPGEYVITPLGEDELNKPVATDAA
jgi:hypothetical protein